MLAVTGACLMVKKKVFEQTGGFCQDLAVAFNDVDLCYSIYEQGYYNIVRNDVTFYHHESLSRERMENLKKSSFAFFGKRISFMKDIRNFMVMTRFTIRVLPRICWNQNILLLTGIR